MRTYEKIFEFIKNYTLEHGYAPSHEEICDGVGLCSKSTVSSHMTRLFDLGYLEKDTEIMKPRAYRVKGLMVVERRK